MKNIKLSFSVIMLLLVILFAGSISAQAKTKYVVKSDANGVIGYYVDGELDTTFNGFAVSPIGNRYRMANGVIDKTYTCVINEGGQARYYRTGKWQMNFTGFAQSNTGNRYRFTKGVIDTSYTLAVKEGGVIRYYKEGMWRKGFNGIAKGSTNYWLFKSGSVDTEFAGLKWCTINGKKGWHFFKNGRFTLAETVAATNTAYYYVKNGTLDLSYTGYAMSKETGYFYQIVKGKAVSLISDKVGNELFVLANLDEQKVYLVKNGKVIYTTDCVSGNVAAGHRTPTGTYKIYTKETERYLTGPGYKSYVHYWMPFNGGIGLHDADEWRSEYGGNIYKYNGSHGCINLPKKAAKYIFKMVKKGTTVVVVGGAKK